MTKFFSISSALVISFFFASAVLAVGSGGGGGGATTPPPPNCSADTWSCDDWSECGLNGTQTRVCSLSFNCPTAETPKPETHRDCSPSCTQDIWDCTDWSECAGGDQHRSCVLQHDCLLVSDPAPIERQACVNECLEDAWSCGDWSACTVGGRQFRTCQLSIDCPAVETPPPTIEQNCTPDCDQDIFECDEWSQCQFDGQQRRECRLVTDCPDVNSTPPPTQQVCPGLQCGQLPTLAQRVECRLNLTEPELAAEFNILYFPEYCKAEETPPEQRECISLYQSFGACWQVPLGPDRFDCARNVIGMGATGDELAACQAEAESERADCAETFKEKVEKLILFHMYEVELKAEMLLSLGRVSLKDTAEFVSFVEERKAQVEKNPTARAWKLLLWQVRDEWQRFTFKLL